MDYTHILNHLPYSHPFLFVDQLISISEQGVTGNYTFPENSFFYKGHFKNSPVTPGVILTECMAQIGLVCLGIFLLKNGDETDSFKIALSSSEMDFLRPVYPKEKVTVISEKVYFRFGKLKCSVKMFNNNGDLVAKGNISGMIATAGHK